MKDSFKNIFSPYGIWKNWGEWFSLTRNLIYINWNKVLLLTNFSTRRIRGSNFLRKFLLEEKFVPLVVTKLFIIISLRLEGIIGSNFMKKWKIKAMILSKSIIDYHYKELGFTWLLYFHFPEKYLTLRQGFYSKQFCLRVLGKSQLFLPYIRIACTDS